MQPYVLERSQFIPHAIDAVFAFFCDAGNLERITPPWMQFNILTPAPIEMRPGAVIRYALSYRGIPLRWTTEILVWRPPEVFVDVQTRGPYRMWHHTHRFESEGDGTRMIDVVRYALPFGPFGRMAHTLSVRRDIEAIFDYRHRRITELFGARDG